MPDLSLLDAMSIEELRTELNAREASSGEAAVASVPGPLADFDDATLVAALISKQKVIYGVDDRVDLWSLTDPARLTDADSVVALFNDYDMTDNGDGTSRLWLQSYGTRENLCVGEPFRNQPAGAFGSGFLVDRDVIATAGHNVGATSLHRVRFVFGFRMINEGDARVVINNTQIYRGMTIIEQRVTDGPNWALVRLDRPVPDHPVVRIRRNGRIPDGQSVHVIGHPSGLPTKFAGGATVRDNSPAGYFVANLDAYGGSAGSPVFNASTHRVEGILSRGETDFVMSGTCKVSLVCPTTGCSGQYVTRAMEFANLLPAPTPTPLHLLAVNSVGQLWQTIRLADGFWLDFGDVEAQTGDGGTISTVAATGIGTELHLAAVNSAGQLWHTIRRANGTWLGFGDVESQTGDGGTIRQIALAAIGGELHLAAVNSVGQLWHTVRRTDGTWYEFGDVESQTGDGGTIRRVALAAIGGELHLAAVNSAGQLWHTIRRTDGTWYEFGDVEAQTGDGGTISTVALARVG